VRPPPAGPRAVSRPPVGYRARPLCPARRRGAAPVLLQSHRGRPGGERRHRAARLACRASSAHFPWLSRSLVGHQAARPDGVAALLRPHGGRPGGGRPRRARCHGCDRPASRASSARLPRSISRPPVGCRARRRCARPDGVARPSTAGAPGAGVPDRAGGPWPAGVRAGCELPIHSLHGGGRGRFRAPAGGRAGLDRRVAAVSAGRTAPLGGETCLSGCLSPPFRLDWAVCPSQETPGRRTVRGEATPLIGYSACSGQLIE
jgi:hypothetical protein